MSSSAQIGVNTNLQKQDLNNLNISNLTPLSPEVISRQATINIGTIGHVAHGKSTVVKAISGVQTVRFKNELERNITIKLERLNSDLLEKLINSPKFRAAYVAHQQEKLARLKELRSLHPIRRSKRQSPMFLSAKRSSSVLSTTTSIGFESISDTASLTDSERLTINTATTINKLKKHFETNKKYDETTSNQHTKKRRYSQLSNDSGHDSTTSSQKYHEKKPKLINYVNKEYVVEYIESLESVNSQPIFFVKWLNYPITENTWESMKNLKDCIHLETYIEKRYLFFDETITQLINEFEYDIQEKSLTYDMSLINVQELDNYDLLALKIDLILLAHFRIVRSKNLRERKKIEERVIDMMLKKPLYYKRKQQLTELKQFEDRINTIEVNAPIKLENNVDLEVPDTKFQYIKNSFPGNNIIINNVALIGCQCKPECKPSSRCCSRLAENYFAYDKKGRLRILPGGAIVECNAKCMCDETCNNRIIQRGRKNSLCIFKTDNNCGWGLRTERPIKKGEFVCEYVGEIITVEESNIRGIKYDSIGRTYLFDLDYNTNAESVYTIDAAMHGNISHYLNHSCDPNLSVFPFWINNLDVNMPRLAFFTIRSVDAGEELTFDYIRTSDDGVCDYENLSQAAKTICRCGAKNCRQVLF